MRWVGGTPGELCWTRVTPLGRVAPRAVTVGVLHAAGSSSLLAVPGQSLPVTESSTAARPSVLILGVLSLIEIETREKASLWWSSS